MQTIVNEPVPDRLVPLIVDLDGTLLRSDLLIESTFAYIGADPVRVLSLPGALSRGKAALKSMIARDQEIDVAHLPYDGAVLDLIHAARAEGRPAYLASASNERYVAAIASHLGIFDGWFASNDEINLSAATKAQRLVEVFGEKGFDYIGNSQADLAVWKVARGCIAARPSSTLLRKLPSVAPDVKILGEPEGTSVARAWIKLLRLHQWSKNLLVFVPLVTAQRFELSSFVEAIGAFFAFSLAASSIYVVNDLVDLSADRKHRSKKHRPLAAGSLSVIDAIIVALVLMVVALIIAAVIGPLFVAVVASYFLLTTAYTFFLKRKMMIDIVALASLYTIRVIGGGAAISVSISEWLLGFSMCIFTSLALIKRYVELAVRDDANLPDPTNRNYRKSDLNVIGALAASAAFNAVTIFALYISSDTVRSLYAHPLVLWLACPILMYWLGRMLLMAHRRLMDDDPIVFALRDRNSQLSLGLIVATVILAAIG
jgi:4-hydroxybenzoate polyprenyltransferase